MLPNILPLRAGIAGWLFPVTGEPVFDSLVQTCIVIMLFTVILCFLVGELSRNYSQVDKLWSLMPIIYCWAAVAAYPSSPRLWIMALLVTTWGIRLSYNFHRKGGYSLVPWRGEEDYRWNYLRQLPVFRTRWRFTLFNLLFICFYQHLLILLFTSPVLLAASFAGTALSLTDVLAAVLMLLFIGLETLADNQQYRFHLSKKAGDPVSVDRGFLSEGLWSYMRHPNYTAEQAIWVSFYFFGAAASGHWVNPTAAGAILLILLFAGSAVLTEKITGGKYPDYGEYQKRVPKFIPLPLKRV